MSVARHLGNHRKEKSPETAISRDFGAFYSYHQSMERVMGIALCPVGTITPCSPAVIRHQAAAGSRSIPPPQCQKK